MTVARWNSSATTTRRSAADIKIDTDKVQKWMDLGAEMSDTVRSLMKQYAKKADA